jgi:hypothetical protein
LRLIATNWTEVCLYDASLATVAQPLGQPLFIPQPLNPNLPLSVQNPMVYNRTNYALQVGNVVRIGSASPKSRWLGREYIPALNTNTSFGLVYNPVLGRVFPITETAAMTPDEILSVPPRILTQAQREAYFRDGFLLVERAIDDDLLRGVVLTDGLIGTFAAAGDASLQQNRCFLYHVIGDGTGDWKVPAGGMGAVSDALDQAARKAGAEILTGADVIAIRETADGAEVQFTAGQIWISAVPNLANISQS